MPIRRMRDLRDQHVLSQQLLHDISVDVGESEIPSLEAISKSLVIEPQQMKDRGLQIVDMYRVGGDVESKIVGGAVGEPRLHAAAGHPDGERLRMMVAAQASTQGGVVLDHRRSTKLAAPDHQRIVQQAALFRSFTRAAEAWSVSLQCVR